MKNPFLLALTALILTISIIGCSVEPKEIAFGNDHCALCDMTVVDKTFAAQYVTDKGRAYMFDAAECLIRKINKDDSESKMAFILVSNYNSPGQLIDAQTAFYVISENIQSPMGANLASFKNEADAIQAKEKLGGKVYSWEAIKASFQ